MSESGGSGKRANIRRAVWRYRSCSRWLHMPHIIVDICGRLHVGQCEPSQTWAIREHAVHNAQGEVRAQPCCRVSW